MKYLILSALFLQIYAVDHSLLDSYRPKPTALIKSYEKVLKMSLKSLYYEDEREHNITSENIIIFRNCTDAYKQFSDSIVNFTSCATKYARPIHICVECGGAYNKTADLYNNLRKQGEECQEFYFGSDKVVIVDVLYQEVLQLWSINHCSICLQNQNLTEEFFTISKSLMDCINQTKSPNATCENCHDLYANLSGVFHEFLQISKAVCMDVSDTMNITRKIWSENKCVVQFDPSSIGFFNIIMAIAIATTPILFYCLAVNVSNIEDIKIVRQKRKLFFRKVVTNSEPSTE